MAEATIGEIRFFPYRYAPESWLACDGAKHDNRSYTALYATIGATYGGDGKTYFQVPNL
ncbi:tail fiber protein, partial [Acinetobacter baumannii]